MALRKTIRLFAGFGLLIIGIIGLLLPIMPGWIFVIPGLIILGDYFPPVRRLLTWAKAKAAAAGFTFHEGNDSAGGGSAGEPPGSRKGG